MSDATSDAMNDVMNVAPGQARRSSKKYALLRSAQADAEELWVYRGLLALAVFAPLPLASNRTWAIAILVSWAALLLAATLFVWRNNFA